MYPKNLLSCLLFGLLALSPLVAEVKVEKESKEPNLIKPQALVIGADWIRRVPPSGMINSPEFLDALYPGQRFALAFLSQGPERDRLFDGLKISVQFFSDKKLLGEESNLAISSVRKIKAEGADVSLVALKAAGISAQDLSKLEAAMSLVSCVVIVPKWTVPDFQQEADIEIRVTITGGATLTQMNPVTIKVRPSSTWLKEPSISDAELNGFMQRYHASVPPGKLISVLAKTANQGSFMAPAVHSYFAFVFRDNPEARAAAASFYPTLDQKTREALLISMRLAGQDLGPLFPGLPADALAAFGKIEPLQDPRSLLHFEDPVSPQTVQNVGHLMDRCWTGWMATGDQSYLRALVDLLGGAADFPALKTWQETKGGEKGLNAKVVRGLTYQIAGWSISSFHRTDPLVADWLSYWEKDPSFPAELKTQMSGLFTNPAFNQTNTGKH